MAGDTTVPLLLIIAMLCTSRVIASSHPDGDEDDIAGFTLDDVDKRAVSAGHRFMGLGKRPSSPDKRLLDTAMKYAGLGKRPSIDPGLRLMGLGKRPMDASMRYMGLGKRAVSPSMRYMGLGKRAVSPSMRYMGLGKRAVDDSMRYIGLGRRSDDDMYDLAGLDEEEQTDGGYDSLNPDKRPYATSAGFRYAGLGKRRVDNGMRYVGLGKRTPQVVDSRGLLYGFGNDESTEKRSWPYRRARIDPTLRMMGIGR